jgi:hypothetical protein
MPIQLPKYQRQVSPSAQAGGQRGDIGSAGQEWRDIGRLGQQVVGLTDSYFSKKAEAKKQSDVSDYEIRKEALKGDLAQLENDALMGGAHYKDIPEQVLAPRIARFEEELGGMGYSSDVMEGVQRDWGLEREKIRTSAIMGVEKRELADYTERIKRDAFNDINKGEQDVGFKKLDQLASVIGQDAANSMKSLGLYGKATNQMAESRSVGEIETIISDMPKELMEPQQYQSALSYANSRKSTITAQTYAPESKELTKALTKNELTPQSIASSNLPEPMKKFFSAQLSNSLSQNIVYDQENYNTAAGEVSEFMSGDYGIGVRKPKEFDKLLTTLEKLELPPNVLAEVLDPILTGMESQETNRSFYDPKSEGGAYSDVQSVAMSEMVGVFQSTYGDAYASVKIAGFANAYRDHWAWVKKNPNYTKEELSAQVKAVTTIPVSKYLQSTLNPVATPVGDKPTEDPLGIL